MYTCELFSMYWVCDYVMDSINVLVNCLVFTRSVMDSINVLVNCLVCTGSVMHSINVLVNCLVCTGSVMDSINVIFNCSVCTGSVMDSINVLMTLMREWKPGKVATFTQTLNVGKYLCSKQINSAM